MKTLQRFVSITAMMALLVTGVSQAFAAGTHKINFMKADKTTINATKGEKVEIDYETQISTPGTLSIIIYDVYGNEVFSAIRDKAILTGTRTHTYIWDGRKADGSIASGKMKIEIGLKDDFGTPAYKNVVVHVQGESGDSAYCAGFRDVSLGHNYCGGIRYLKDEGVMTGDSGGATFRPDDSLNRVEAAKIIAETFLQQSDRDKVDGNLGHPDLQPGAWYMKYIYIAKKYGVLKGDPNGTMRPGDAVNRAEFAVMFFRAARTNLNQFQTTHSNLADVPSGIWYAAEANAVAHHKLMDVGVSFQPTKPMTRGEVAEWIHRFNTRNLWTDSQHI